MKYTRHEIEHNQLSKEQVELIIDPVTKQDMGWIVDININEYRAFNGPDLSSVKWDIIENDYLGDRKTIYTYLNSLGEVRHRLYSYDNLKRLTLDIPIIKDLSEWIMPIGKFKGKTVLEIPRYYKEWFINNGSNEKIKQVFQKSL